MKEDDHLAEGGGHQQMERGQGLLCEDQRFAVQNVKQAHWLYQCLKKPFDHCRKGQE